MRTYTFLVIFCGFLIALAASRIMMFPDEKFEDCGIDKSDTVDFSEVYYEYVNDTEIFLNGKFYKQINRITKNLPTGKIKITRPIESPWKTHMYVEKFDRGKWNIALLDRKIADFCKSIQNPVELWYRFTSKLQHNSCPFHVGDEEDFDNKPVTKLPDYFSRTLIGKYRFHFRMFIPDGNIIRNECIRIGFEIMEV